MSHTPGPWNYDGDYVWADAIKGYIANPQTEDMRSGAAVPLREAQDAIDANGRLIAAAPELLAALLDMLASHSNEADFGVDPSSRRLAAKKAARAAIAKAEGK